MSPNLSASEQLTHSTVRIECEYSDGSTGVGTGFFFRFADDGDQHVPAIVTNRHVVQRAQRGVIHLNRVGPDGGPARGRHMGIVLDNFEQPWQGHPDAAVDLCAMPIAPLHREAESRGERIFYVGLDRSLIPNAQELNDLTALEDLVMIGYPIGIWDPTYNQPIIRRGITATHPALDYEGRREFMIDAACFPGSSGSPVFLFNLGSYVNRSGAVVVGGTRVKLLGVLYAGPQYTAEGEIQIVNVPTHQRPMAVSRIPSNLGLVIRSERLLDFDAIFRSRN